MEQAKSIQEAYLDVSSIVCLYAGSIYGREGARIAFSYVKRASSDCCEYRPETRQSGDIGLVLGEKLSNIEDFHIHRLFALNDATLPTYENGLLSFTFTPVTSSYWNEQERRYRWQRNILNSLKVSKVDTASIQSPRSQKYVILGDGSRVAMDGWRIRKRHVTNN